MLSVIMPVYNEQESLAEAVARVLAAPCPVEKEIVLVNDCSSDGSGEIAEQLAKKNGQIRLFHHYINRGKGAAIRTAIRHLRGEYAIIQDADLEYEPAEYGILLEPVLRGQAEIVYGSRFSSRYDRAKFAPRREKSLRTSLFANNLLTCLSNLLSGLRLSDMETCYKLIPVRILQSMKLRSGRFGIEPELTARLAKLKLRISEVPISYFPRHYTQGKKINWKDGLAGLWHTVRFNLWA